MKALHYKILSGLGIPVILFVIVLLIVNFFYVDYQLKTLTYSYVGSIAREADNKLTVKVKEIEELAKVLAVYLRQAQSIDESRVRKLLYSLLDADEGYDIFIVRKPWVIEGKIQGNHQSALQQRNFNGADELKYRYYLELARQQNAWSQISLEDGEWKTSYVSSFEMASDHAGGIIVVNVLVYELVENLLDLEMSENAKILITTQQDAGESRTLSLDANASKKIKSSVFDISEQINLEQSFDGMSPVLNFPADAERIHDLPIDEGQTFISKLPSSFGPNMQLMALVPKEEIFMYIYRAKLIESVTVLIAFFGLVLLIILISKSISKPISMFTRKVEVLSAGNLNVQFPETDSCIELNSLSRNLNKTVKQLKSYFLDLKRVTAQSEKINSEINISHDVQMSLLPPSKEQAGIDNMDIHACALPAREVGGDFYYFFKIDQDRIALLIGDVSGKGMPAAIMMAVCLSLFKAQSANTPQPDACLQKINRFLMQEDTDQCVFVTLFYAIVNTSNGELIYANAGHNPPLIVRKTGAVEFLDQEHGVALAVTENAHYRIHKEKLNDDDMLLLYTDGITEAYNMKAEEFGEQRLIESIPRLNDAAGRQSAKCCVQNIIRQVARFIRGNVQFDDMTLLCAVMREANKDAVPVIASSSVASNVKVSAAEWRNLHFQYQIAIRYDIQEINNAIKLIDSFCKDYRVSDEAATDLCVAIDEFMSNIIYHSQSDEKSKSIKLQLAKKENLLLVVLKYQGKAFDPLHQPVLDIHRDWRTRPLGGLGIYIGRQLTDHISYTHSNGQNVLVIEKKI